MRRYIRKKLAPKSVAEIEDIRYFYLDTPEGVTLTFQIPPLGSRLVAITTDLFYLMLALIVAWIVFILLSVTFKTMVLAPILILCIFLIRNGYFIYYEIKRQGSTPGKQKNQLQVIDRRGQHLSAYSIIVRNIIREIEFFIPVSLLFSIDKLGLTPIELLLIVVWMFFLLLFPCFNRDRLRIGDLVAGTIVVEIPEVYLWNDLSRNTQAHKAIKDEYKFTPDHLKIYGIYELQTLEKMLRELDKYPTEKLHQIVLTICKKIKWNDYKISASSFEDNEKFLQNFYRAQRAYLEHKLQLGDRKDFKNS